MSQRIYSVKELEELRAAVENKYLFGVYNIVGNLPRLGYGSRVYRDGDKQTAVEEMVRTHMLAGHTAQDLLDSEK